MFGFCYRQVVFDDSEMKRDMSEREREEKEREIFGDFFERDFHVCTLLYYIILYTEETAKIL